MVVAITIYKILNHTSVSNTYILIIARYTEKRAFLSHLGATFCFQDLVKSVKRLPRRRRNLASCRQANSRPAIGWFNKPIWDWSGPRRLTKSMILKSRSTSSLMTVCGQAEAGRCVLEVEKPRRTTCTRMHDVIATGLQ